MAKNRKNPKYKGLPHKSPELSETASIFEQPFDVVRTELGEKKEFYSGEEIAESAKGKFKDYAKAKQKKLELAKLQSPVDFTRHIENLVDFKYDLEGFLEAIKQKYGEDPVAKQVFEQYRNVESHLKLLIDSLKRLN